MASDNRWIRRDTEGWLSLWLGDPDQEASEYVDDVSVQVFTLLFPDLAAHLPAPGECIEIPEQEVKHWAISVAKDTKEELDEWMRVMGWQRIAEPTAKTCRWTYVSGKETAWFNTGCGHRWSQPYRLADIKFCPFCGLPIASHDAEKVAEDCAEGGK